MALTLSAYQISITYIPGYQNEVADTISRSEATLPENLLPPISEIGAAILMDLFIPPGSLIIKQEKVKQILEGTNLPSVIQKSFRQ